MVKTQVSGSQSSQHLIHGLGHLVTGHLGIGTLGVYQFDKLHHKHNIDPLTIHVSRRQQVSITNED